MIFDYGFKLPKVDYYGKLIPLLLLMLTFIDYYSTKNTLYKNYNLHLHHLGTYASIFKRSLSFLI